MVGLAEELTTARSAQLEAESMDAVTFLAYAAEQALEAAREAAIEFCGPATRRPRRSGGQPSQPASHL